MDAPQLTAKQKRLLTVFKRAKSPITAKEAWSRVGMEEMGLATVYRAIKRLTELNLLRGLEISDAPPLFELVSPQKHHHHFYCTECGQIYEVPKCVSGLGTLVPKGFKMRDHSITLYGECATCLG